MKMHFLIDSMKDYTGWQHWVHMLAIPMRNKVGKFATLGAWWGHMVNRMPAHHKAPYKQAIKINQSSQHVFLMVRGKPYKNLQDHSQTVSQALVRDLNAGAVRQQTLLCTGQEKLNIFCSSIPFWKAQEAEHCVVK